jgi:hypothetical protein
MNVLDEDIIFSQRRSLESFKIHFRQIGVEIGRSRIKDLNEVIPLLHQLKFPTFFTLDHGFYTPKLRHPGYCMVHLDVRDDEAAQYVRRFLSHAYFRTQTQRIGNVVRAHHNGLSYWRVGSEREHKIKWQ